jgi:flagellar motor switch protein FliM
MDSSILYSLVDALMGGLGIADATPEREISDIEIELLNRVHGDLLRDFENAWRPWFPLRAEHVRADRTTQVLSTLPDEEVCHVGKILVTGDVLPQSPIYFVLPYTCLEPLHEAISARAGEELDPNWRANLESNLRETEVALVGLLGEAEVPASVVRRLAPGDVIELDRQAHEPLSLLVEGQETFRGQLGKNHHKYAMRIASKKEIQHRIVDRTLGQVLIRKGLISREQLAVAQVDELLNRRPILDSIVGRGWAERRVLEHALAS